VHIGKSVVIKGELNGSEDLTIEGHVEGKIELRDLALLPVAKLRHRALEAHAQQRRLGAAFLEQVQGGRVEGRGAVVELDAGLALEERYRHARARNGNFLSLCHPL